MVTLAVGRSIVDLLAVRWPAITLTPEPTHRLVSCVQPVGECDRKLLEVHAEGPYVSTKGAVFTDALFKRFPWPRRHRVN